MPDNTVAWVLSVGPDSTEFEGKIVPFEKANEVIKDELVKIGVDADFETDPRYILKPCDCVSNCGTLHVFEVDVENFDAEHVASVISHRITDFETAMSMREEALAGAPVDEFDAVIVPWENHLVVDSEHAHG